jgi:hypothetical protein
MQLEISTGGVDVVVSRVLQFKNDNDGRQKADQDTVRPVQGRELVTLVDPGAEGTRSTPPNNPVSPRDQLVTVVTPWSSQRGVELSRRTARMRAAYMRTRCARR